MIAAVLACGWPGNKTWKWEDTRKLMEYGLTFTYKEWFSEPELPKIPVLGAKTEESGSKTSKELMENLIRPEKRVPLVMDLPSEQERGMLMKDSDRITMEMELPKTMNAPVKKGTIAGRISYYLNGELFKTYAVTVGESAQKTDFAWTLRKVVEIFTLQFSMG